MPISKQARPGAHGDLAGGGGEPMMKVVVATILPLVVELGDSPLFRFRRISAHVHDDDPAPRYVKRSSQANTPSRPAHDAFMARAASLQPASMIRRSGGWLASFIAAPLAKRFRRDY